MKKNNVLFLIYFCVVSMQLEGLRDPFMCMVDKQTKKESVSSLPLSQEKKKNNEASQQQWSVKETRNNGVVLEDTNGNIREISFSDSEK